MVPQPTAVAPRARPLAADDVPGLGRRLARRCPLAVAHADGAQAGPVLVVPDALGGVEDRVAAVLLPPVAAVVRLIGVVLEAGEAPVEGPLEARLDVLQKVRLV